MPCRRSVARRPAPTVHRRTPSRGATVMRRASGHPEKGNSPQYRPCSARSTGQALTCDVVVAHRYAQRQVGYGASMCVRAYSVHCVRTCMSGAARVQARASAYQRSSAPMLVQCMVRASPLCVHAHLVVCCRPKPAVPCWLKAQKPGLVQVVASSEARPAATSLRKPNRRRLCADKSIPRARAGARRPAAGRRSLVFAVGQAAVTGFVYCLAALNQGEEQR